MKTANVIKLAIDEALEGAQFQRKSNIWYRDADETVIVVDLQKSNFAEQYYVNLGVLVKGLALELQKLPPKEHQCHIRVRLDALEPSEGERIRRFFDLEDRTVKADARKESIVEIVRSLAVPFLDRCSTLAGIREVHAQGKLGSALVHRSVRDITGAP